jgi:catechol 2,3-dioxygenase
MTGVEGAIDPDGAVGRVALRVGDSDRASEFYETVVGLDVLDETADGPDGDQSRTVLGAGGSPLLVLVEDPDAPERARDETGLFHTAFRVPTRSALADALSRVERRRELDGASDHLVSEALYLADPEGNGVEIYRDRPRSAWEETDDGLVRMATRPLALEPLREAATGEAAAPPSTDVGHVHLEVSSVPDARAFYVDVLGLSVRQTYGDEALFLAAGDYHHHVGVNVWNGRTAPPSGRGLDWFELVATDRNALGSLRDRVRTAGHEVTTTGGLEVTDPDGITLRLVAPE